MAAKSDTQIGIPQDAGDRGVPALCVRKDTGADVAGADGDYAPPQLDSSGNLRVNIAAGSTSGTQYADGAARGTATGTLAMGDDGTNIQSVKVDAAGELQIDVLTIAAGDNNIGNVDVVSGIITTVSTVTNLSQLGGAAVPIGTGLEATAVRVTLPTDGTGVVRLGAGTAEIGKLAAGVANIGDVDILTIAAGDNNIGNVDIVSGVITTVSTVTAVTALTGGGVAHDAADSGNPHKIGMIVYSPDGTTPGTAVAELDRSNAKGDLDGRLFVNARHPRSWSYHENSSAALTDTSVQAAPGAGFEIVVTTICVSTGAATALNFFLEEVATTVFGPIYLEATAGRGFVWSGEKRITANTALTITTSAAIAHSVDIQGYIQAV